MTAQLQPRPVVRINRPLGAADASRATRAQPGRAVEPVQRSPRLRIGLLGGSFNPAHAGHRAISLAALKHLRLHRVWWLVSPQNPLKATAGMAGFAERLASARQQSAGHPRLIASDLEQRLGTRYTVDTMTWLRRRGRADFVWLIGADNLAQLPQWHRWLRLLALVPIAVFDREPYSYRALAGRVARRFAGRRYPERLGACLPGVKLPAWVYLRLRRYPVSSTAIRQERATGRSGGAKEG